MMYLVEEEPLEWFPGVTRHGVECKAGQVRITRRRSAAELDGLSDAELAEMLGNFVYSETGDYYFARQVVRELAIRLGVDELFVVEGVDE